MRTPQEVFDIVSTHLLTQNAKSVGNYRMDYGCLYRGPEGRKCAIGILIADEDYTPQLEGETMYGERVGPAAKLAPLELMRRPGFPDDPASVLANRLQWIHDAKKPHEWREYLTKIAREYGLTIPTTWPEVAAVDTQE